MDALLQCVVQPYWQSLPEALATRLLVNAASPGILNQSAAVAASFQRPELASQLCIAAWLADPLHGPAAAAASALPPDAIPKDWRKAATVVAAMFHLPERTARLESLETAGQWDAMHAMLQHELRLAPKNLFWRWYGWFHAMGRRDGALAGTLLEGAAAVPPLRPIARWMGAESALLQDNPEEAASTLASLDAIAPWHFERLARAYWLAGAEEAARKTLYALIEQQPWRLGALLALRDMTSGLARAVSYPANPTAICLYSYNKADELEATLQSLASSETGGAIIRILDNGSTDATAQVCAAWADRLGERCTAITLPVNVGAAPARNWLLALPEVQACEFVAFLDDDVLLPPDWLGRLHAGLQAFPGAGLAGARVLEDESPRMVQQAEQFFSLDDTFAMADAHRQCLDTGHFVYARPCLSVTGCCHLFRRAALDAVPAFDIRYSPTQYDDVDHDLALVRAGLSPLYQGHLAIRHKKRSGRGLLASPVESANAAANFHKLRSKWQGEKDSLQQEALAWTKALVGRGPHK